MRRYRDGLKTAALLGLLTALVLAASYLDRRRKRARDRGSVVTGHERRDLLLVRRTGFAVDAGRPGRHCPSPQPHATVLELATAVGRPMPRLYISPIPQPNAFATGRGPRHAAMCVTDEDSPNPFAILLMLILGPLAAAIIQLAIGRSREYEADADGACLTRDPLGLASALVKIEHGAHVMPPPAASARMPYAHLMSANPLTGHGIAKLFRTHSPTEDRVWRLRQMAARPDYDG
jgi:heat shock protein HtpX